MKSDLPLLCDLWMELRLGSVTHSEIIRYRPFKTPAS
jgi:hypothetical protein